ncbi:MAG: Gfo/Idh/MocA family oxidoreductase [Armatimonadota bacterium]
MQQARKRSFRLEGASGEEARAAPAHEAVFGIIGAGHIANSQHLPNLTRAPHVRLKTVCDLDRSRLEAAQAAYGIPHAVSDMEELLADEEIQAVVLATKDDTHVPLTLAALRAGKSVYVEKPLADTAEACEAVVEAQRASGKLVAVGFNRRFAPAYVRAKELGRKHGGIWNFHYRIADEYWRWGRNLKPGTRVMHEVCHIFDILRWMTGQEVESVYCVASRADDEVIAMQMSGGCVASIVDSGYGSMDMPKEYLAIMLERGAVTVEDFVELRCFGRAEEPPVERFAGHTHPKSEFGYRVLYEKLGAEALYAMRRGGWEIREQVEGGSLGGPHAKEDERFLGSIAWNYTGDKGWLQAVDHFAECLITGARPDNAGPVDGLEATRLALAAMRSRETGEVVRMY